MAWISENKKILFKNQNKFIEDDFRKKGRKLRYFGLPSGDIIDFEIWYHYLGEQIIAVEYDEKQLNLMHESINFSIKESQNNSNERAIFGEIPIECFFGPYFYDINDLLIDFNLDISKISKELCIDLIFPFDVVSLGYTSFFSKKHKKAFKSLLDMHNREYLKKKDPSKKDFLLFYSVNTQRCKIEEKIEIDNIVMDAKGWSIKSTNNAIEIFDWLDNEGKIRDKLIVALPYFIIRESYKMRFEPEPLGIYLWQTETSNNYFLNVVFRFSHIEDIIDKPPNEKLERVPIKSVLKIEDGEIKPYETDMPAFRIISS